MAKFDSKAFREELKKRMPGFDWTVRLNKAEAEGRQSAGFNRTATLIVRQYHDLRYEAAYYGFGMRSGVLAKGSGLTVARALRNLQDVLEHQSSLFAQAARTMLDARTVAEPGKGVSNE